ncbi:uncharacterized protein LOC114933265 [Nylanderia fulva]|uniref:uncharacterized protein LOC114933265 n=1 Tax=Nylanderia fulva TaxID=613905 RepID=UPI0010FBA26D|nr:uncharacterized protein LOC114931710 isoform X3 [Nylanderia fulva]XP_029161586.1 uncharacterized protein LOC114933265 [Nylanderia fulva]
MSEILPIGRGNRFNPYRKESGKTNEKGRGRSREFLDSIENMIETENDEESNVTSKLQLRASSSIKETGSQSSENQPDKDADMELTEEIIDSSQGPSTRTRNAEDDTQTTNRKEQENINKQVLV